MRARAILIATCVVMTAVWLGPVDAMQIEGRATVVDGDTIEVAAAGTRVRLYGIDAPEGRQTCRDAAGKRYLCGGRAARALSGMLGRNGIVSCAVEDTDRYGRAVAECRLVRGKAPRGTNLNEAMVRRGWALEYERYSDGRYAAAQVAAQRGGVGLWQGAFVAPWDWRRRGRRTTGSASASSTPAARRSCRAARTCREAVVMWCAGYRRADGDRDGIPCENVCRSKRQVDAIRRGTGC